MLEAAAIQKPAIATDVPGCRQVVEDQFNGFLCKLKDPIDLAHKMITMATLNQTTLATMGINGRRKVENSFQENNVIRLYERALDDAISFNTVK